MKSATSPVLSSKSAPQEQKCEHAIAGHSSHLHAANCGHKSYVHAGHICFEHDGHYHYMHNGHAHECAGPFAQPPVRATSPMKNTGAPAQVIRLDAAKVAKNKKK